MLGSLLGVILMLVASSLWTPPLVWFALCFLVVLLFSLKTPVTTTIEWFLPWSYDLVGQ